MVFSALKRFFLTATAALLGVQAAKALHIPLPWMLGAMLGVACAAMAGQVFPQPRWARRSAQVFIGSALGLFFTPLVFQQLWGMAHWVVIGSFTVMALSLLVAPLLQKWAQLDGATTLYAVSLGGAAEMSMQAQDMGADAPMVALSHTVRIVMVTLITSLVSGAMVVALPTALPSVAALSPASAGVLLLSAGCMGAIFVRCRIPSPWKLGALLAGCFCALAGMQGRWPQPGMVVAQMVVGWGLGQNMTRLFFTRAPSAMLAMAATTLLLLVACMGIAWFMSLQQGMPLVTAFLAMAPGGMTEMGLIAKLFGLAVPVVIAFHLMRVVLALLLTQPIGNWLMRRGWIKA